MVKKKFLIVAACAIVLGWLTAGYAPLFADEDVQDLKRQIEALQKRVDELESSQAGNADESFPGSLFSNPRGGWDPFEEMRRMQDEMDRMFRDSFGASGRSDGGMFSSNMSFNYDLDMRETDDGYEISLDMQGLDQEKLDIEVNEHSITVKGERSAKDTEETQNSFFSSQSYGSFMKTIPLPVDADTSKVKTEKEGDRLVIKLPKKMS